jgi:hypothetical protein
MEFYKATRPDGLSFRAAPDGTRIDYAAALASGEVIRHPAARKVRNRAETYLSVSVAPADCTGFGWPCRLFRVEPVGRVMANLDASPNKRAVSALRVVEELPAWQALGPNGEAVAALIDRCRTLTDDEIRRWDAARDAAWYAAWYAARDAAGDAAGEAAWEAAWYAARDAAWDAAREAAWDAAGDAAREAAWEAARYAARYAAWALLVRDLITAEQFDTLTGPWVAVMGRTWEA